MAKVLLIEDNEMNRDMLSRRLIRRGFQVVFAMDGQQGVDLARSELPDIILMDLSLPVIDGWEATRRVKADEATRSVPVIGLTAHAMAGDREKAIEAGGREVMLRVIFDIFDDLGGCPRFTRKQKAELWEHRKCGQ